MKWGYAVNEGDGLPSVARKPDFSRDGGLRAYGERCVDRGSCTCGAMCSRLCIIF